MTQPTAGLGHVVPSARRDSAMAARMYRSCILQLPVFSCQFSVASFQLPVFRNAAAPSEN